MKIERRKTRTTEVYTASLNDIMFFLLLFFLIISTMVTPSAIRVLLPNASTGSNIAVKKNVTLIITEDLHYFIDNKEVAFDNIEPQLTEMLNSKGENEEINIILQADKNINLQNAVNIIDIGNRLQVKVTLVTQKN